MTRAVGLAAALLTLAALVGCTSGGTSSSSSGATGTTGTPTSSSTGTATSSSTSSTTSSGSSSTSSSGSASSASSASSSASGSSGSSTSSGSGSSASSGAGGSSGSTGCAIQPALLDLGADAGGTPIADDFNCPATLDASASTAVLDFGGSFVRATQSRTFEPTGDGGEGAWNPDGAPLVDGGFEAVAAGLHELSAFGLDGGMVVADGDLALRVAGPFTILNNGQLFVRGNLLISASGPVDIEGSLFVAGDITIEQPTSLGVTVGRSLPDSNGATIDTGIWAGYSCPASRGCPGMAASSPGNVTLETRGALQFPYGYIYGGGAVPGFSQSGDVVLRSYGDLTLGGVYDLDAGSGMSSYIYVGGPPCLAADDAGACVTYGANGALRMYTEGTLGLLYGSYLYAGHVLRGPSGGDLDLRAVGGVQFSGGSFAYAGYAGSVDVLSQGDVSLTDGFLYSGYGYDIGVPTNVAVRARSLSMTNSYAYAGGQGGTVTVATAGDVTLDKGSYIYAADAVCAPGGNLEVDAQGNLTLLNRSMLASGWSRDGASCGAVQGGDLVANVGGALVAPDAGIVDFVAGDGGVPGAVSIAVGVPVSIGVLDAQLEPSVVAVSQPQPAAGALLFGAVGPTDPASFFGAHLAIAADGGAFAPVEDLIGQPLPDGWRYELLLQPRMFDDTGADGVTMRVP